jgi:hypothetical protein
MQLHDAEFLLGPVFLPCNQPSLGNAGNGAASSQGIAPSQRLQGYGQRQIAMNQGQMKESSKPTRQDHRFE